MSRNPFLFRGPIPTAKRKINKEVKVAIPSYSEVLFLLIIGTLLFLYVLLSRNPFLFRGPIPTFKRNND